jgi:hypothetical protein
MPYPSTPCGEAIRPFQGWPATGQAACSRLQPLRTPHSVRLRRAVPFAVRFGDCLNQMVMYFIVPVSVSEYRNSLYSLGKMKVRNSEIDAVEVTAV